jgi:hypothetical protein
MKLAPSRTFASVQEGDDPFLALWPHVMTTSGPSIRIPTNDPTGKLRAVIP